MPSDFSLLQKIAVWAIPVLFAITVHEAAHGYAARAFGDNTAAAQGRLSLNPLRHIDPLGTVILPGLLLLLGGFLFGWAKPVPVVARNLRDPRRDMALVALAGPLSNALMALGWALLLKLSLEAGAEGPWLYARLVAIAGIAINITLMVLNLLPIPPLDGGRVLSGVLPPRGARLLGRVEPYGLFILLGLLLLDYRGQSLLSMILREPMLIAERLLYQAVNINPAIFY